MKNKDIEKIRINEVDIIEYVETVIDNWGDGKEYQDHWDNGAFLTDLLFDFYHDGSSGDKNTYENVIYKKAKKNC